MVVSFYFSFLNKPTNSFLLHSQSYYARMVFIYNTKYWHVIQWDKVKEYTSPGTTLFTPLYNLTFWKEGRGAGGGPGRGLFLWPAHQMGVVDTSIRQLPVISAQTSHITPTLNAIVLQPGFIWFFFQERCVFWWRQTEWRPSPEGIPKIIATPPFQRHFPTTLEGHYFFKKPLLWFSWGFCYLNLTMVIHYNTILLFESSPTLPSIFLILYNHYIMNTFPHTLYSYFTAKQLITVHQYPVLERMCIHFYLWVVGIPLWDI